MLKPKILDLRSGSMHMGEFQQPNNIPAMTIMEIIDTIDSCVWADDLSLYITQDMPGIAVLVVTFRRQSCDVSVSGNSVRVSGSLCTPRCMEFDLNDPGVVQEVANFLSEAIYDIILRYKTK